MDLTEQPYFFPFRGLSIIHRFQWAWKGINIKHFMERMLINSSTYKG